MTCIRNEIPYFGLTLTESHKSMLLAKLENLVWQAMTDESDQLHEPNLTDLMKEHGILAADDDEEEEKRGKKKQPKGRKPKKRNAAKKPKANAGEGDESEPKSEPTDDEQPPKKTAKKTKTEVEKSKAAVLKKIDALVGNKKGKNLEGEDSKSADDE